MLRVSGVLVEQGANLLEAAQFDDVGTDRFFVRVQSEMNDTLLDAAALAERFAADVDELVMQANFYALATRVRALIMVSKQGHCLNDLLFSHKRGNLPINIASIVRNNVDYYQLAASYNIAVVHLPVTAATKLLQGPKVRAIVVE